MNYSILWPSYMGHAVWQDLGSAIDATFAPTVDVIHTALKWVRTTYIPSDATIASTQFQQLIDFSSWTTYDQTVDIQRLNFLGLNISEPDILRPEDTSRFIQNIGSYWFEKGKASFIDFLGFCLNVNVTVTKLWTEDYVNFVPEGDPSIGTTVLNGGTWYPTTHVRLLYDNSNFAGTPVTKVVKLFYDICPYNLVIESVYSSQNLAVIRTDQVPVSVPQAAPIIFTGNITHSIQIIPSLIAPTPSA